MSAAQVGQMCPPDVVLVGQNTRNVTAVALKNKVTSSNLYSVQVQEKYRPPYMEKRLVGTQHHFVFKN